MARVWTKEQNDAINARNVGIIVSAAAGSGKTSVLVERLLRQLSDTENKIRADRLIVVTFTNDAAVEMKQRLMQGLSDLLEKNPENDWLSQQQSLIQTANISTIHSFCFNLIRENIQSLNISSGFRILDESEEKIILKKAMEDVFEEYYKNDRDKIRKLTDFFCVKGDYQLEEVVNDLYRFAVSVPFYIDFLNMKKKEYEICDFKSNRWTKIYIEYLIENLKNLSDEAEKAKQLTDEISADKASLIIENEKEMFKGQIFTLMSDKEWNEKMASFAEKPFDRISFPKYNKGSDEDVIKEKAKAIRDKYKKSYTESIIYNLFTENDIYDDFKISRDILELLIEFLKAFDYRIKQYKEEKNAISFSDAEQLTIKLLCNKDENGKIVKTTLAESLSDFYKIIMIDEFQDANNTQDLIFKMLSHNGDSENYGNNVFLVGDVKQSIYRFRLANPGIFLKTLKNCENYIGENTKNSKIKLNKNFRSSKEVISFVNYLFKTVMGEKVGEIVYDDDEKLVMGAEFDDSDRSTEIMLIPTDEEKEETQEDTKNTDDKVIVNQEAFAVAEKIKKMISEKYEINDHGEKRACMAKDFCILLRNRASEIMFAEALQSFGITAKTDEVLGYLKSREITILTNLLKVIDNPFLDIPLAGVLMSPMFAITAEELARIRVYDREECLYKALCKSIDIIASERKIDKKDSYYAKAKYFYETLKKLRIYAAGYSLERLIRMIYDSTDFLTVVQIYKDGDQKKANLRLLLEYARIYEENQGGGLTGFLNYLRNVSEQGGDLRRAGIATVNNDIVYVKTIHKSKGLEFPFVFLCRSAVKFNKIDMVKQMQISFEEGIAFRIQKRKELKKYVTLPYIAIRNENDRKSKSEELRLLYVALTRAKEKLFITYNLNEKSISRLQSIATDIKLSGGVTQRLSARANCMQDFITMCLLMHEKSGKLKELSGEDYLPVKVKNEEVPLVIKEYKISGIRKEKENAEENEKISKKIIDEIRENINFSYDDKLIDVPGKLSVTELIAVNKEIKFKKPSFMIERKGMSGAEKGTVMHTFMQYANYDNAEKNIMIELENLINKGIIGRRESKEINIEKLTIFFNSNLYKRIKISRRVLREKKFLVSSDDIKINEITAKYSETGLMIQGIADCIFEEDDGYVLVDYKTDYVKDEGYLQKEYENQLRIYEYALNNILEKKIKETEIYSFYLEKSIKILKNNI